MMFDLLSDCVEREEPMRPSARMCHETVDESRLRVWLKRHQGVCTCKSFELNFGNGQWAFVQEGDRHCTTTLVDADDTADSPRGAALHSRRAAVSVLMHRLSSPH